MRKIVAFVVVLMTVLTNCSQDCTKKVNQSLIDAVPKVQLATDIGRISTYLTANSLTAVEDPSGLRYTITTLGTGHTPCLESGVLVNYSGKILQTNGLLASNAFDATNEAATFTLNKVPVLGVQIGLSKFPAGTSAILYVPSGLAYGNKVSVEYAIPANSVLVYEIELVSFNLP